MSIGFAGLEETGSSRGVGGCRYGSRGWKKQEVREGSAVGDVVREFGINRKFARGSAVADVVRHFGKKQ